MKTFMALCWFLLGALFNSLFDGELRFKVRQLARSVVRKAIRRLPCASRGRYEEEWLAELESREAEGRDGAQLLYALDLLRSSGRLKRELRGLADVAEELGDLLSRLRRWLPLLIVSMAVFGVGGVFLSPVGPMLLGGPMPLGWQVLTWTAYALLAPFLLRVRWLFKRAERLKREVESLSGQTGIEDR